MATSPTEECKIPQRADDDDSIAEHVNIHLRVKVRVGDTIERKQTKGIQIEDRIQESEKLRK